eukprot:GEMP01116862.1.p1 GENE.GEMP01116862.1~~GEMP01116862.1.p1  ORF type:complete len:137 (-),score=13.29 GEMP01116862.1:187-597(-)
MACHSLSPRQQFLLGVAVIATPWFTDVPRFIVWPINPVVARAFAAPVTTLLCLCRNLFASPLSPLPRGVEASKDVARVVSDLSVGVKTDGLSLPYLGWFSIPLTCSVRSFLLNSLVEASEQRCSSRCFLSVGQVSA